MLSKKEERTFSNGRLRDQWEKRAQSEADQCKQEAEWKKQSSLKLLFSKWDYHLTAYTNGDKTKGGMSDFRRLTSGEDGAEKNKPKIKFKIVPPPPRTKVEPPPPPPPPRRRVSPRPHRPKRKVEVDVFRLCWKESWMSLKPPKYLFLKAAEIRDRISGFTTIEVTNNRKYQPKLDRSEEEVTSAADKWSRSWKQVKSPAQMEFSEQKQKFEWEILFERDILCKPQVEEYCLPRWAGTWKIMNFVFRQQKRSWDCVWPEYPVNHSNKSEKLQELEEQDELSEWDESWKLSGAEFQPKVEETLTPPSWSSVTTARMLVVDVYLLGWSNSWLLSAAPPEEDDERQKSWTSCWRYRPQIRWRCPSLKSHEQHSETMMRRRRTMNVLLTSQLDDDVVDRAEWTAAWKTPKGWIQPVEDEEEKEEVEEKKNKEIHEEEEEEDEAGKDEKGEKQVEEKKNKEIHEDEEEEDDGVEKDMEIEEGKEEDDEEEEMDDDEEDKSGEDEDEEQGKEVKGEEDQDQKDEKKVDAEKEDEEAAEEEDKVDEVRNEEDEDEEEEKEEHVEMRKYDGEEPDEDEEEVSDEGKEDEENEEEEKEGDEEEEEEETEEKVQEKEEDKDDEEENEEEEQEDEEDEEEPSDDDVMVHTEEDIDQEKVEEQEKSWSKPKPDVLLHLQFHKLHASFSSWSRSWMVAVAHRGGDQSPREEEEEGEEGQEEWWRAWKICRWKKPDEDEVTCFSTEHRSRRHLGLMQEQDGMPKSEWTLSWRMNNTETTEEEEEDEEEEEKEDVEEDEEER